MKVRLEQIRGNRSLDDLADELGVSTSTVQRWEKQTMSIPSLRLTEIARVYGCSVKDIFEDDEQPEPRPASEAASIIDAMNERDARKAIGLLKALASDS